MVEQSFRLSIRLHIEGAFSHDDYKITKFVQEAVRSKPSAFSLTGILIAQRLSPHRLFLGYVEIGVGLIIMQRMVENECPVDYKAITSNYLLVTTHGYDNIFTVTPELDTIVSNGR